MKTCIYSETFFYTKRHSLKRVHLKNIQQSHIHNQHFLEKKLYPQETPKLLNQAFLVV